MHFTFNDMKNIALPLLSSLAFMPVVHALDTSGMAPEAGAYFQCVYELRNVDAGALAAQESSPERLTTLIIVNAFANCNPEEQALRRLGAQRGLTADQINTKVRQTQDALEKLLRTTIAREIVKDNSP